MSIPTFIVGTGGLGRGVAETVKVISERDRNWTISGFIDDDSNVIGTYVNDMMVVGDTEYLLGLNTTANVIIAIANPEVKAKIYEKLSLNTNLLYPNVIHPSVHLNSSIEMGIGNIVSDNVAFSANVYVGNFSLIHFNCTIGHDVQIEDYVTVYPGVNLSGYSRMKSKSQAGTNSSVLPQIIVGEGAIIGAGSTVIKNPIRYTTVVGIPAKELKN
ncbi:NeuD/PglB/VioB family sugar acetyltransferase [Sporosarcina sp. ACRSL]|uniref:NeuD/PglB/VioB family sugar acetyltransferase n=1 Tax=Sporosarcina sp. ACRSL TaxID=2918215 RepID=UPI001EF601E7|nr:NeuD/PglB/VioB family sugar acetyltransferase [Sporosarcina sp. ACRSL]MCG7343993.1 NeuD/PglB/VioB family sugar acetyltransferase [Sporosarcina sp. ACRSL]